MKRELGIYIHIPFCERKCNYCDFLSFPADPTIREKYFDALNREIRGFEDVERYEVISVFFGGGTPSLPDERQIIRTLDTIRKKFILLPRAEITIECNPGTLTEEKLCAYYRARFNRLSIGLQTADNGLLKKLGRIHTFEVFKEEYEIARNIGFNNISVDLMYGLPGQTLSSWSDTLDKVLSLKNPVRIMDSVRFVPKDAVYARELKIGRRVFGVTSGEDSSLSGNFFPGPEHISAYCLLVERDTPFWKLYSEEAKRKKRGERTSYLPDEEEEDLMLRMLKKRLACRLMRRYEISNYARPGRESVHNIGYWKRREYAGFGIGASSQIGRLRYKNHSDIFRYIAGNYDKREIIVLTKSNEIEETMFLGLRTSEGVNIREFEKKFHVGVGSVYGNIIEDLTAKGLIETKDDYLKLTERGFDIGNVVMSEFILC